MHLVGLYFAKISRYTVQRIWKKQRQDISEGTWRLNYRSRFFHLLWWWRQIFVQKCRDDFIKIHDVISQKAEVILVTPVIPPNPHFIRFSFLLFFVTFYSSSPLPPSFLAFLLFSFLILFCHLSLNFIYFLSSDLQMPALYQKGQKRANVGFLPRRTYNLKT